ncbi:MAG: glycosyltransferase [Candidatus Peribacteraceae bacterium]|nr:glycosyltransferase [Candidatus Peribacteraceae bacterium]MDD5075025.1 glycosyltransferase [Candidatus Peribacteraceae bacterium]
MKVALVHELLTMRGGAERVFRVLADMFPDAPIYTLLYDERKLGDWFPKERVRTSGLQNRMFPTPYALLPTPLRFNHHLYLKKFPAAVEAWDFSEFDLVISSSSAFAHGIITNGKPKHLCFVNSPARYLWDRTHDVLERTGKGILGPLKKWYLERSFHDLRIWDAEVADRPDRLIAASKEVQRRIELYWRRESTVIHPPIDDFWFTENPAPHAPRPTPYALIVSTLVPYKRIDRAIAACERAGICLKIVGEGPAMGNLKKMANENTEFCGYRSLDELKNLFANAEATIVPGEEDFNLVALESMACGTPVLSLRAGGPLETIIEGKTGAFFDEPTADSLAAALRTFKRKSFDPAACREQAKKFSRATFETAIREVIGELMK